MSIKLRVKYRYRSLLQFLAGFSLPAWVDSFFAKATVTSLVIFLGVGYMFQINNLSTRGYAIHTLESQVASLQNETGKLETAVAHFQSMASIEQRLDSSTMVAAANIRYVKLSSETAVAAR